MRRFLLGTLSLLILFELLSGCPVQARVGAEPEVTSHAGNSLDPCQRQFTEALRAIEREREYAVEKVRYQEAVERRCAEDTWYHLGFLECVLFVPLFGLVLPFFGLMFFGTLRSVWVASSRQGSGKETDR